MAAATATKPMSREEQAAAFQRGFDVEIYRDLATNPVDEHGYTRFASKRIADLDWHAFEREDYIAALTAIRDAAQRAWDTAHDATRPAGLTCKARIGGEGTIGGANGEVRLWYSMSGHPVALA
jgi:hypothetical protein